MAMRKLLQKARIAALLAATAAGVAACSSGEAGTAADLAEESATAPLPVNVVMPKRTELAAVYRTTATLAADAEARVPARVDGEVVRILVEEGDTVAAGQVLAELDGERLLLQMNQAKAELEKTQREYDRLLSLHDRGLVSSASFEGMQFTLAALQANYELKRLDYGYTRIRAPIAGVVSARAVKLGQHLAVNAMAFQVTETARLVAYLNVPQNELAKISAGNEAAIVVDALPGEVFVATIERISPTIDARNGTFRATAYVDNDSGDLAPGMFGRFEVVYEKRQDVLTIPVAAVLQEDEESAVYVVADGAAVRRTIEIGIENDGLVEILSGVDENDSIVVVGQDSLRDGSRVLARAQPADGAGRTG